MTTPKNKRLPKARVMYQWTNSTGTHLAPDKRVPRPQVCAVIPCPTAAKARQIVKAAPFLTMTEEEQVERLVDALKTQYQAFRLKYGLGEIVGWADGTYEEEANVILAAITGGVQ